MERERLIAAALACGGEYDRLVREKDRHVSNGTLIPENVITILDDDYPDRLKDLRCPPLVLFYKGDLSLLKEEAIAIVGSRNACSYALRATEALARSQSGRVVVSGLAKGVDAAAHRSAERTIGVLGCGIDVCYPEANRKLIEEIAANGLVISEYPGLAKPLGFHFPFRNRIICALADTVYIMQSTLRSGTMTTVNEALELGRDVRVLPYGIFDIYGSNNNHLIYEGAQPILKDEIAF